MERFNIQLLIPWWFFQSYFCLLFSAHDKFFHLLWLMSLLSFFCFFIRIQVEKTVRHGYKTTKLHLSASVTEILNRIESLMAPLGKLTIFDMLPNPYENNNIIETIILYRQCERFLHDLLNTLVAHQLHIDRCLKSFRSQLNKIHEIVIFRTAIPITSIFVSISTGFWVWFWGEITGANVHTADSCKYLLIWRKNAIQAMQH